MVDNIRDTASGSSLGRPGIERLRQLLRQGAIDVVVAYAVDRLSRNQNHIGILFDEAEQAGAKLEFATENFEDNAIGRFILAARAFVGEVEREKIAERTMRGKAERARSGKITQGTVRCYGYVYVPSTGHRGVNEYQSLIVKRIFQRYAESRSYSAVSQELNKAGVPALAGGKWYPLTIRRILLNESYAGRLIYRKTKRVKVKGAVGGRGKTRVVQRPEEEWICIDGACPRIVAEDVWQRVQAILGDPERTKQITTPRFYLLKGRTKCGLCGAAVVGQTLTVKRHPFKYYRCRHAYDKNTKYTCTARYVRGNDLEDAVWCEVKRVLANPKVVLQELESQVEQKVDRGEIARSEKELDKLAEREKKLVHLYTLGAVDDEDIRKESEDISLQRGILERNLRVTQQPEFIAVRNIDQELLNRVCEAVAQWIENADESERTLALEALQIEVEATKQGAVVSGVLPVEAPEFIRNEQSCRCSFNGE